MVVVGGALAAYLAIVLPDSPLRDLWNRYVNVLDGYVKFLLLGRSGEEIARIQTLILGGCMILFAATGNLLMIVIVLLVAVTPYAVLDSRRRERIVKLEQQLDGWLMMLANSLKATPAIGEALRSTAGLVQPPMAEELDLMVKRESARHSGGPSTAQCK